MVHGTLNIVFFRNKTFLFVKIEIWNFQHLFDSLIHETLQNFSSFGQLLFPIEKSCLNVCLNVCLNDLKFCKGSLNPHSNICWKFQLSILTNKKGLFLKKSSVPWIVSFFSQTDCFATLLLYMALSRWTKSFGKLCSVRLSTCLH